ncbi:MAG TPA: flagellar biosynthesis protein FliQ [Planctomycetota bacterium]|jgi:flagellar biosynthetic protein FliQ|nr:flagellar biosynthesis protein FliQ [Planctomycetota bacterium]OQC21129.1 MAG: Flagellar biosynthetic protein FliQ [Planctomycetes bacterium ADurb.Bin069]NMD34587.1 flagellar biosynthesis protein FliQ [Planctomycetota bacterium]HNR99792.1 flagellar biosynthesis protein FliQ [Planctomycetota bacterium]HNU26953.1 flagellar biosynthesis protein FliQ [Planctomycetota bacterium]
MEGDALEFAVEAGRTALWTALALSLPLLAAGLIVGLAVSLLQAVTQIQEQTLSFVPKILAITGTLLILMPWMLRVLVDYTHEVFMKLPESF